MSGEQTAAPQAPGQPATPQAAAPQTPQAPAGDDWGSALGEAIASMTEAPAAETQAPAPAAPAAAQELPGQSPPAGATGAQEPAKTLDSQEGSTGASEPEPKDKFLDSPEPMRPQSLRERLLQQEAQRKAQSEIEALREELTSKYEAERQQREAATFAQQQAQKLVSEGKFDEAIKALQLGDGFSDLQKRYLESKGAIPKEDPRVTELQSKLQEFEKRDAERRQVEEQQRQQREQQQRFQQEIQSIQGEMKGSEYRDVQNMAELPAAVNMVRDMIHADIQAGKEPTEADMVGYYKQVKSNLVQWRDALIKALPTDPGVTPATPPGQPGVSAAASATQPIASPPGQPGASVERGGAQAPTTLSQEQSSDVGAGGAGHDDPDAHWRALMKDAEKMMRGELS